MTGHLFLRSALLAICLPAAPAFFLQATAAADIVVAADGGGDFTSIQDALDTIPRADPHHYVIHIRDGLYPERLLIDQKNVTLRGESREGTLIVAYFTRANYQRRYDALGPAVINIYGENVALENLTIVNRQPDTNTDASAIYGQPAGLALVNCDLLTSGTGALTLVRPGGTRLYLKNADITGAEPLRDLSEATEVVDARSDPASADPLPAPPRVLSVAADGSGDFTSIQAALDTIPRANREPIVVRIGEGTFSEKILLDQDRVTLQGAGRDKTRVELNLPRGEADARYDGKGPAVFNVFGDDNIVRDMTIENTQPGTGHAFAIYGQPQRFSLIDCDALGNGGDTVSLWNTAAGMYYHKGCRFRGAVDFVCPRGWCYVEDSEFFEASRTATLWHDGHCDMNMKFVLRNCKFDGVEGFHLGRNGYPAAFYLIDCTFSANMADRPFYLAGRMFLPEPFYKRYYFHGAKREGGEVFAWMADNLNEAPGAPAAAAITAAWTFDGRWDPTKDSAETAQPLKPIRIAIVGDSTVADYAPDDPLKGWGYYIHDFFNDKVTVINRAANGRSSMTFLTEGRWDRAKEDKPDYVLVQFGHNDNPGKGPGRETDAAPGGDFRANLTRYVNESREIGARPILLTPVSRRHFGPDDRVSIFNNVPYAHAAIAVAQYEFTPVVDLNLWTRHYFNRLGDEGSAWMMTPKDRTHFSPAGAARVAAYVVDRLRLQVPELRPYLVTPENLPQTPETMEAP
jgi:pectinesterase